MWNRLTNDSQNHLVIPKISSHELAFCAAIGRYYLDGLFEPIISPYVLTMAKESGRSVGKRVGKRKRIADFPPAPV